MLIFTITFKVCKSVHHRTIQINYQPVATIFRFSFPDVYLQLNMFRAFSRPSSGARWLQWQPLVLPLYLYLIELQMMGGKTPETCWAVNKRQDKKLKNCCIWLVIYLNLKFACALAVIYTISIDSVLHFIFPHLLHFKNNFTSTPCSFTVEILNLKQTNIMWIIL